MLSASPGQLREDLVEEALLLVDAAEKCHEDLEAQMYMYKSSLAKLMQLLGDIETQGPCWFSEATDQKKELKAVLESKMQHCITALSKLTQLVNSAEPQTRFSICSPRSIDEDLFMESVGSTPRDSEMSVECETVDMFGFPVIPHELCTSGELSAHDVHTVMEEWNSAIKAFVEPAQDTYSLRLSSDSLNEHENERVNTNRFDASPRRKAHRRSHSMAVNGSQPLTEEPDDPVKLQATIDLLQTGQINLGDRAAVWAEALQQLYCPGEQPIQYQRRIPWHRKISLGAICGTDSEDVFSQIEKDLDRTFPYNDQFDAEYKQTLRRVCEAYAIRNLKIGYCQVRVS